MPDEVSTILSALAIKDVIKKNENITNLNKFKAFSLKIVNAGSHYILIYRDVAQSGSALHWGCSGRRFKSGHPDHFLI